MVQEKRPSDVVRQIRLLRQYMSAGAVNEAYTHVMSLSPDVQCSFATNVDWNRCACDVFKVSREMRYSKNPTTLNVRRGPTDLYNFNIPEYRKIAQWAEWD